MTSLNSEGKENGKVKENTGYDENRKEVPNLLPYKVWLPFPAFFLEVKGGSLLQYTSTDSDPLSCEGYRVEGYSGYRDPNKKRTYKKYKV